MSELTVSGLCKSFGRLAVLRSLELTVPSGELLAVLGPSGSGKTTLLRILAGFERPDAGTVTLGELAVNDGRRMLPPQRRKIGYVPQEGGLFPHLTVAANVAFGLSRGGTAKKRVAELLARVGLTEQAKRFPHQLSGGQQQRVALARALAIQPAMVLLDEPFSALDAALRTSVRADVRRILRESGCTAILVTHDQDEALSMADQVAVIRDGQIAQCATPQELYTRPVDPALAEFVGKANLVPGTRIGEEVHTAFGVLRPDPRDATSAGRRLVLLRPEQLQLSAGVTDGGVSGSVVDYHYHGHDAMVAIQPDGADAEGEILARPADYRQLRIGARVTVTAQGTVTSWAVNGTGAATLADSAPVELAER